MSNQTVAASTPPVNASGDPQPPAQSGWTDSTRGTVATVLRWLFNKWTAGLLAVLLALGWIAGMPPGDLRLASFPGVSEDPEKVRLATELFQRADAKIEQAVALHQQLSLAVDHPQFSISIPPPAAPDEVGLKQFVPDLTAEGSLEKDNTKFSVKINGLAIMERSYSWLGLTNYFVVIKSIKPDDCPKRSDSKCWEVVAQYWPSPMRPVTLVGDEDELAQNLSVLVLRGALRNEGDEWRKSAPLDAPPPFIMATETPSTMAALEATARGIQILKLGEAHPDCQNKTDIQCVEIARTLFQSSIDEEKTLSPVASFGQALIEIDAALQAARRLDSDLTVEAHLNKAEVWTNRALSSEFLRAAMQSGHAPLQFGLLELGGLAPDPQLVDLSRRFACALADYRRANWEGCVSKVGETADFPPSLQPYVEAAKLDASLSVAARGDNLLAELSALQQRVVSLNAEASKDLNLLLMLRRIMLKHACERPTALDDDGFDQLVHDTISGAQIQSAYDGIVIEAAYCRNNQQYPPDDEIDKIISGVSAMPPGKERERFVLQISQYRMRRGQLDAAFELAKQALSLPWAGAFVRNSDVFARLRNSTSGSKLIAATFQPPQYTDLETCQTLE